MDDLDGAAAFTATLIVIGFIALSRRIDREEITRGRAKLGTNVMFYSFMVVAGYGILTKIDHPFWGDVMANVTGGLAALALVFVADHLFRFLRAALSRK